jgi:hypothetical protein
MKKLYAAMLFSLLLFGCMGIGETPIKELKDNPDKYVGEKVTASGTVENTIKIGSLSGYSLVDENGNKITVSSKSLPAEGSKKTVSGVFMKDSLFGYYLQSSE